MTTVWVSVAFTVIGFATIHGFGWIAAAIVDAPQDDVRHDGTPTHPPEWWWSSLNASL